MMLVRSATPSDLTAIAEIQRDSPEASQWHPLDYTCRVAVEDSAIAGFLVTRETATDESEILNLAVRPMLRRRGVAKMLVLRALNDKPGAWFLEVRESNRAAIGLYKSLGFQPSGRREKYYDEPAEAAIVMRFLS